MIISWWNIWSYYYYCKHCNWYWWAIKKNSRVQVVGWPPVRSHRINVVQKRKPAKDEEDDISSTAMYVKVSMDGAPYLRKIDLKVYKDYKDLRYNLEDMFTSFLLGKWKISSRWEEKKRSLAYFEIIPKCLDMSLDPQKLMLFEINSKKCKTFGG